MKEADYYQLSSSLSAKVKALDGPILIFGAGGFIGINLLKSLLLYRKDVYGASHDFVNSWRLLANKIPMSNLINCDITEHGRVEDIIKEIKPKTIFNLAAYGAYSKQKEYNKIYATNFNSTTSIVEVLKKQGFSAYIHAGSSSEYGLNSAAPREDAELVPNTHYSVSKVSTYYLMKYYGKVEELPVIHLRLYSAFGPWEEPDRLMPVLLAHARNGKLPQLVNPDISRDFIYISDICSAFIFAAYKLQKKHYGEVYNVGTGHKTTIKELVELVRKKMDLKVKPKYNSMPNRNWDMKDWYGNISLIKKELKWAPEVNLEDGLDLSFQWQKDVNFDNALWNWTNRT
jgi:polyisoprenyl-phosphate glycosyltransferase